MAELQTLITDHSSDGFSRLAEPLRREMRLHCYRMMGSLHEAEDLVQDSYLRAWRSFSSFHGGSFRAWLYKITTNACLNAIEQRKFAARLMPDQVGDSTTGMPGEVPPTDVPWLEPYPDSDLVGLSDDQGPEARYTMREAVRLAFVAVIQQLPPRQRAVLLLCDVLGLSAQEAATLLESSAASVNSALQRGRETLAKSYPEGRSGASAVASPDQQALLDRYASAWERHDVDGLIAVLKEDAMFTMPPWLEWYSGRGAIGAFFGRAWQSCPGLRLVPTAANMQPAFGVYLRSVADGEWTAFAIQVLSIADNGIAAFTAFQPPAGPSLFSNFGLPPIIRD